MRIGLCTSITNASAAAEAGFDFIEENVQSLLVPNEPEEAFAPNLAAVKSAPLKTRAANCFVPATLKCTGPDADVDRLGKYAATAFRRAQQAGIRTIVFGSGGARQMPAGYEYRLAWNQFLEGLRRIASLAQRHDVTIVIEPLNRGECNFLNTLKEGADMVMASMNPHVRLLADIYHMRIEGEGPGEIVKQKRWLHHVHVAEKEGRFAPGTGGEDFGPYLRALKEANYEGAISFECGWKQFPEQAAGSLKGFREQVDAAGL